MWLLNHVKSIKYSESTEENAIHLHQSQSDLIIYIKLLWLIRTYISSASTAYLGLSKCTTVWFQFTHHLLSQISSGGLKGRI